MSPSCVETDAMSARACGVIAVLFASACFTPNYGHTTCGPDGECPSGLGCSSLGICQARCSPAVECPSGLACGPQGICEAGGGSTPSDGGNAPPDGGSSVPPGPEL